MANVYPLIPFLKVLSLASVFFVWFIRYDNIVKEFKAYGYSNKLRDIVGILKITAVLLIQSSEIFQVQIGGSLLAFLMLCALVTHLRIKNPLIEMLPSTCLMIFSILIVASA